MKKILILILFIAITSATYSGCVVNTEPENKIEQETEGGNIQQPDDTEETSDEQKKNTVIAPDFELESLDGSIIKLSEMKDKNIIMNFWYTGCPYCVAEMPDLQKLQDNYPEELLILLINTGETKETAEKFMDENNLNMTVLLDKDMSVTNNYGVRSFPTTIAVNKDGEVVSGYIGMLNYEQMESIYEFFE